MTKIISSFKFQHNCSSYVKTAFLLLVLLAEILIAGNITSIGPEFQVNTSTYWSQYNPDIASDNSGNFVITWTGVDIETVGSESNGVFAQRFSSTGTRLGGEFRVNSTVSGTQAKPAIAMDQSGDFVIAWKGNGSGDGYGIFAQRYNSSGVAQGGEFRVNNTTAGDQNYPDIAMDEDGNFVICWVSHDGYNENLYAKRFAANGSVLNNEFKVNTLEHRWLYGSVSMADDGRFVVGLCDSLNSSVNSGVFARIYDSSGNPRVNEFMVSNSARWDSSVVGMKPDGSFTVFMSENGSDGSIYAKQYDTSGFSGLSEFSLGITGFVNGFSADTADDGSFVVTWFDSYSVPGNNIYARCFFSNGTPQENAFRVNATAGSSESPTVSIGPFGQTVFAWTRTGSSPTYGDVFAQRIVEELTLTSLDISGPLQVGESSGTQYTCTAYYDNGSSHDVTDNATWNENSHYADIDNNGYLTTYDVLSDQLCAIRANFDGMQDTYNVTISETPVAYFDLHYAPYLFKAEPSFQGNFGTAIPSVDPLSSIDPKPFNTDTFGNNLETQYGWQRVEERMGFTGDDYFKGQWSRIGTRIGTEVRLFGETVYGESWRNRSLETTSLASFDILDYQGSGDVPVKVTLEYDMRVDGTAFNNNAAFVINEVIPLAVDIGAAIAKGGVAPLLKLVGINIFKKLSDTKINFIAEDSTYTATSSSLVQLKQNGVPVGDPLVLEDGLIGRLHGSVLKNYTTTPTGDMTVYLDSSQPVDVELLMDTRASALGWAQSYMGITHYRLEFDMVDIADTPLVFEQWDPVPETDEAGYYKDLILASAGTPELVTGSVEIVGSIGTFTPDYGDKLIICDNNEPSGFLLPVEIEDNVNCLTLHMGAMVSDPLLANKCSLQIVFIQEEQIYNVTDYTLDDIFSFEEDSGVIEKPYSSPISSLNINITHLPQGNGSFLIAFGNTEDSGLHATLVIDSFALGSCTWPDPSLISIQKCAVKAGKSANTDKISISGTMDITEVDLVNANQITIVIESEADDYEVCNESLTIDHSKIKKGKYTHKSKAGFSLKLDMKKGKFTLQGKNINLTGLSCPLALEIEVGNYFGEGTADESIVNGKKTIPIQFMSGYKDTLPPPLKIKAKKGKKPSTDSLSVKGGFSLKDEPSEITSMTLFLGDQPFVIPGDKFTYKVDKKSGNVISASYKTGKGETPQIKAKFDFVKCTYSVSIKKAELEKTSGQTTFGVLIDMSFSDSDYNESVPVNLD